MNVSLKCLGCGCYAPLWVVKSGAESFVCESCDDWAEKEVNYRCGYEVFK